jgi:hypothetical protein
MRVTQSFDPAQDRELVEWQMGVFRRPQWYACWGRNIESNGFVSREKSHAKLIE